MKLLLARLLGRAAEFFPGYHFYSKGFLPEKYFSIPTGDGLGAHTTRATTAMLAVSIAASQNLKAVGATAVAEFTNVTDGGRDIGSFRVTIERLSGPEAAE